MTEITPETTQPEKTLYRYTSAVERGDFETVIAILQEAESDPQLEALIVQINAELAGELGITPAVRVQPSISRWQHFWQSLNIPPFVAPLMGAAGLVVVLAMVVNSLLGPAIGNTFDTVSLNLQTPAAYQQPAAAPTATPYPSQPREISTQVVEGMPAYPAPVSPTMAPAAQSGGDASSVVVTGQPRLVVRTAYLSMTVADPRRTREDVVSIINRYAGEGAYILFNAEGPVVGADLSIVSMNLRVPVGHYDEVMHQLVALGQKVIDRREEAQDVTGEYVDVQARIKQLETTIERLTEIMREAKDTDDLLKIEKTLTDREVELEALKGRGKYLEGTSALSLIQLQLNPPTGSPTATPTRTPFVTPTPLAWNPGQTASRSTSILMNDLRRFIDGLIVFSITGLPWLLAAGLLVFAFYRFFRWLRRSKRP